MKIEVMKSVLEANEDKAKEVRTLLKQKKVVMLNLISSPGSGKTSLLERTLEQLGNNIKIGIIEGDVATDKDAKRLQKYNVPIVMINTEGGCHLDSASIEKALGKFDLVNLDLIFVENVGNLVCPTAFDLGENAKVAVVSTTEGDDKPAKYPMLFREAAVALLNKIDLVEHTDFNKDVFYEELTKLNSKLPVYEISCTKNIGLASWLKWLEGQIN
ncbi:hydrogenase nickel incorporation protein HypB [Candidatus Margulisiibacteriota bacterium]